MSKECEYCNWEANGDIPDDRKMFISTTIKIPFQKSISKDGFKCTFKGKKAILFDVLISRKNGEPVLQLYGVDDETDTELEKHIKINYCPMCGRRLTDIRGGINGNQ